MFETMQYLNPKSFIGVAIENSYTFYYFSFVSITTVGYGDVYPVTLGGKVFTFFVLIIGIGVVAVPAGLVGTALSKARELED